MKNNKNKQNLITLQAYECVWIDVKIDPQSQMKFERPQRRMKLQVYRKVSTCRMISTDWSNMRRLKKEMATFSCLRWIPSRGRTLMKLWVTWALMATGGV